jgi:hypothetical protein
MVYITSSSVLISNVSTVTIPSIPDAVFDETQTFTLRDGDSVSVNICITNLGNAPLGDPFYVTLYRDSVDYPATFITTDSISGYIQPGDTACLTVGVRDINPYLPFVQLVVRLNDRAGVFPFQTEECDLSDSIRVRLNPALDLMMRKSATLGGEPYNGFYANPAALLYTDTLLYEIAAVNANLQTDTVFITDTLPPYLEYVVTTATIVGTGVDGTATDVTTSGTPQRNVLTFEVRDLAPYDTARVRFKATPAQGASASQPLYINTAWVEVSDTLHVATNSTYHQGAGISVVLFSATAGGAIYNAGRQALDFRTTPRTGVLVVPDSGYVFAGWSHDAYTSLRGEVIPADSGILRLDSLVIYGNVELRANFVPGVAGQERKDLIPGESGETGETGETGDKVWSHDEILYVRTKKNVTVRLYTPDGILRRRFETITDGVTTLRPGRGIHIVTLNGGTGWKITNNE